MLVLVFAAVAFFVTWIFDADVDAQAGSLAHFLRFILWGSGEVAPVTREVLRRAEPDRSRRQPTCTSADGGTAPE